MTADPNGWPDASKPGRPLNPERDGWHWLCVAVGIGAPYPMLWSADGKAWDTGDGWVFCTDPALTERRRYLGPCLLPEEVAAREAAAAEAMRDACAAICARHVEPNIARAADKVAAGVGAMAMVARDTIRALPIPAADALARALDQARKEEREACASVEVRVTVPDGADEWSPLEAWEEALSALDTEFRAAIRARGKGKETEG